MKTLSGWNKRSNEGVLYPDELGYLTQLAGAYASTLCALNWEKRLLNWPLQSSEARPGLETRGALSEGTGFSVLSFPGHKVELLLDLNVRGVLDSQPPLLPPPVYPYLVTFRVKKYCCLQLRHQSQELV